MVDPVLEYIEAQRKKNIPDLNIKQALLNSGYKEEQIGFYFIDLPEGKHDGIKLDGPAEVKPEIQFEKKKPEEPAAGTYVNKIINKIINLEFGTFKIILLIILASFLIALVFVFNNIIIDKLISENLNVISGKSSSSGPMPIDISGDISSVGDIIGITNMIPIYFGIFIASFIIILVIKIIEIFYLLLMKIIFLKNIKFRSYIRSYSICSFVFVIFIVLSLIYSIIFLKIFQNISVISVLFFPIIGLIMQYILLAETTSSMGVSRIRSYLVLTVPFLFIIAIIVILIIFLTPVPYEYLLRYFGI